MNNNDLSLTPTIALLRAHLKSQATLLGALVIALTIILVCTALPAILALNTRAHTSRQADLAEVTK